MGEKNVIFLPTWVESWVEVLITFVAHPGIFFFSLVLKYRKNTQSLGLMSPTWRQHNKREKSKEEKEAIFRLLGFFLSNADAMEEGNMLLDGEGCEVLGFPYWLWSVSQAGVHVCQAYLCPPTLAGTRPAGYPAWSPGRFLSLPSWWCGASSLPLQHWTRSTSHTWWTPERRQRQRTDKWWLVNPDARTENCEDSAAVDTIDKCALMGLINYQGMCIFSQDHQFRNPAVHYTVIMSYSKFSHIIRFCEFRVPLSKTFLNNTSVFLSHILH